MKPFLLGAAAAFAMLTAIASFPLMGALTSDSSPGSGASAAGVKRVIYMSAVEYKGGTNSEPFPAEPAPEGGGYIIKPPDSTGRWETSTYRWEPGVVVANKGDEVELWIWGVNGSQHPATIERYVPEFTVTRGNLKVLKFTADQAGTFRITCNVHPPSMEALLVVLP
jgi:hypothetical protein